MTTEDKQLLLKDLCARLPYGVIVEDRNGTHTLTTGNTEFTALFGDNGWHNIKPYLRPMSSITEEEMQEYVIAWDSRQPYLPTEAMDWLNEHHFDYRGLIEKGLALEATEGMYKQKD